MKQKGKTVLCVDDDADDRELLGEAMQQAAPEIGMLFAENGLQALALLAETHEAEKLPSLIVLDLNMPYLDGRQTYARIKEAPALRDIPLVILSTSENPTDKALFTQEGIPFFNKPIDYPAMQSLANQLACLCK